MIIKCNPAGNVGFWSKHLLRDDTNERGEVKENSGLSSDNLPDALREMRFIAAQSRSQGNFMYSANLNIPANEHLTPEQWIEAIDTLEKNLGLEGHQRVIVEHVKNGRQHYHVVWNRVDVENLHVADMGGNYRIHTATARELENRFDLTPTPTPTAAKAAPALWEIRVGEKTGIDGKAVETELTELWKSSDSGQAFVGAMEERGYILAKGNSRDFCAIDQMGGTHSLARRLDGVKTKELREFLKDIDRDCLPTVADAVAEQRDKARPATELEKKIRNFQFQAKDNPQALGGHLVQNEITIARADKAGIDGLKKSQREARENGQKIYMPRLEEGELCAINKKGAVYRLNPHQLDIAAIETALTTGAKTIPALSDARAEVIKERAADQEQRNQASHERQAAKRDREAADHKKWSMKRDAEISRTNKPTQGKDTSGLKVLGAAGGVAMGLCDFVGGFLASLGGSSSEPPPKPAHVAQMEQIKAQRKAYAALENIRDSIAKGEGLSASDVKNLTPTHLQNISRQGDDYLRNLVERMEYDRQKERENDQGRTRER